MSLHSPQSRARYEAIYRDFGRPLTELSIREYIESYERNGAAPATCNLKLSVLKSYAKQHRARLEPIELASILAIEGVPMRGVRMGKWLSLDQVRELLAVPPPGESPLRGLRDRALLAMLVGTALRRTELVSLTVGHLEMVNGRLVVLDLTGKGNRIRTVPVPEWARTRLEEWLAAGTITCGPIWRRVLGAASTVQPVGIAADRVHTIVQRAGARIGVPKLAPHDLRRTFAQLARARGADLEQIQLTLGHASLMTTERYLGGKIDLVNAACDRIEL